MPAVLGVLRRRYRLILIGFLSVLLLAALGLTVVRPAYTASALVMVDPSRKDLLDPSAGAGDANDDSARVDSEVEIVKSDAILTRAVREAGLLADPSFLTPTGWRERWLGWVPLPSSPPEQVTEQAAVSRLDKSVAVQRRGMTYVIMISATAATPALAAKLANAVASAYIRAQVGGKVASIVAARDIVDGRTAQSNADVIAAEGALDAFIASHVAEIADATGRSEVLDQFNALTAKTAEAARLGATVRAANEVLGKSDYSSLASLLQSDEVSRLATQQPALQTNLTKAAPGSAQAQSLQAQLQNLQQTLAQSARAGVGQLKAQFAAAQAEIGRLRTGLRTSLLDGDLPPGVLTDIYALQQNAEIARAQYQKLIARSKDLEGQAYLQVADSRVVSPATAPDGPSFPNTTLTMLAAAFVGLGVGGGLALVAETVLGGFTSEEQLRASLRLRSTVTVPTYRTIKRPSDPLMFSPADAVVNSPLSVFSEGIRKIRLGIDHAVTGAPEGGRVIMVTSSEPDEGKTTLSLGLVRAYSLANKTALLIDCDLRKPSVHRHLGVARTAGLMDYLIEDGTGVEFSSILVPDPLSQAHLALGAGRSDIATDQLLTAATFSNLIALARRSFDIVILDTPPVGPVVDGLYLTQFADAVVFAVQWARTPQREVRNALAAIETSKPATVPVLTVLTQRPLPKSAMRARYAGYYSD